MTITFPRLARLEATYKRMIEASPDNSIDYHLFHDRLQALRKHFGFTQKDMADLLGVGFRTYQRLESSDFRYLSLLYLLSNFGANPEWLLTGKGPMLKSEKETNI